MAYRIEIVVEECMSSGRCVSDYPDTFGFDDDELASLIINGTSLTDDDMIRAARNCPSQALRVRDADGNLIAT